MASVAPHVHISGLSGLIQALYVIVVFGVLHLVARRYEGHPLADAFLDIWA
jgi:hypothetical protein